MHNRKLVVMLHRSHTDYIEEEYRQAMSLPGNPEGIEIFHIGDTKIFSSNRNRLENRAIFTGNETFEEIRQVIEHFEQKGVTGFFEVNPANFYRSNPFSWKSEMLPAMIEMGCHPAAFRCVWYLEEPPRFEIKDKPFPIRRFSYDDIDDYVKDKFAVEPVDPAQIDREEKLVRVSFTGLWSNFISYENGKPVSISKLLMKDGTGYLAWGFTMQEFRRRGHHRMHVLARAGHAFESGCETVFSVTDFNIPSSMSLQKVGFKLAYNYLLLEKRAVVL